jgi:hypothetical protein
MLSLNVDIAAEFDAIRDTENPTPDPSIGYLIVLSGANSYARRVSQIKFSDLDDDYNRTELAIATARKIVALKTKTELKDLNEELLTQFGPTIVYNGGPNQNNDLRAALDSGAINYPKEKFKILELPPTEINTKGQFISLKQDLALHDVAIGIITHAYHYPRVARMIGEEAPLNPFGPGVKKFAFLVDREFTSPGIEWRISDEIKKIPIYAEKGDLAWDAAKDVTYLPSPQPIAKPINATETLVRVYNQIRAYMSGFQSPFSLVQNTAL